MPSNPSARTRSIALLAGGHACVDVHLVAGAISATLRTGASDWRRLLELVLNGLRPRT